MTETYLSKARRCFLFFVEYFSFYTTEYGKVYGVIDISSILDMGCWNYLHVTGSQICWLSSWVHYPTISGTFRLWPVSHPVRTSSSHALNGQTFIDERAIVVLDYHAVVNCTRRRQIQSTIRIRNCWLLYHYYLSRRLKHQKRLHINVGQTSA